MDRISDVLESVRRKDVRLWCENGQLHYRAPKGALTQEEIDCLRASKGRIIALLEGANGAEIVEPRPRPRRTPDRTLLTFSQLAHWRFFRLSERRAIRQIASATRLRGRLNIDALQASLEGIIHRQDALRTRVVVLDGIPWQEISERGACEFRVEDLRTKSEGVREAEVVRIIEQHILEPIDIAAGPLLGVRLLRLGPHEHVLIVAMEHIIADAFSMDILLRDLFTAYTQKLSSCHFSLPEIPVQFADYALWQRSVQKPRIERHVAHSNERLAGCQRMRFPGDRSLQTAPRSGWGTVPLRIESDLKAQLSEFCRARQTTLVMGVFTAYVGLALRWCSASESVIRYQSDGRVNPGVENTIGFFASPLYLRIELRDDDSFLDLMDRVIEEYCRAYEYSDFSYMAAQVPCPEFTRNTIFNWVPQKAGVHLPELEGSEDALSCSAVPFLHPMLRRLEMDHEPSILLYEMDEEVSGDVYFPLNRFSMDTMKRFGGSFLVFIRALLSQPEGRVKDVLLR